MKSYYYVDEMKIFELRNKVVLFYILISGVFGLWFIKEISIIIKGIATLALLYLVLVNYYRIKNLHGLRKNPFELDKEMKVLTYYNEFRGNVSIDINRIRSIKGYTKKNGEAYLLEVFLKGKTMEENINVEGMSGETISALMNDLIDINSEIHIYSNASDKDKNKKKVDKA